MFTQHSNPEWPRCNIATWDGLVTQHSNPEWPHHATYNPEWPHHATLQPRMTPSRNIAIKDGHGRSQLEVTSGVRGIEDSSGKKIAFYWTNCHLLYMQVFWGFHPRPPLKRLQTQRRPERKKTQVFVTLCYAYKGPAKRGHFVAPTLLTWSCFPNGDSFCHTRKICGGHKFCVFVFVWTPLDPRFSENLQKISCGRAARNNIAAFCHGRATSRDTMLPPQHCVLVFPGPSRETRQATG